MTAAIPALSQTTTLTIDAGGSGKPISPDLIGIFFEDISYASDGGLYAELLQNRSFDYKTTEQPAWNSLSFWELVQRDGGKGSLGVEEAWPIHPNNPTYLILEVAHAGSGTGVLNPGFDGIPVRAGETYDVSFFARQLYMEGRWDGPSIEGKPMPVTVHLESQTGETLATAKFGIEGREWNRYEGELVAKASDPQARFVLLAGARGGLALDNISLFPRRTFRNRRNGLREDLAQVIADLKPKFVRFPGGCVAHGNGLGNMYRWKDTIGPVEHRKSQGNLWGYHQSNGLGYFEFFQFCEDIGAKPLPVVPAGVCCQNSGCTGGMGQKGIPMEQMPAYVQEVLDLIEWANGPADSRWGGERAAAGHPEPFHLKYLGVGNEDKITPEFEERFQMIYEAVRKQHPEIVVVGTSGPSASGEDYERGWEFANELQVPMVDEHYYMPPQWFWDNADRYDKYDRSNAKVYLGEYAAFDEGRKGTLRAALAEAAHLINLERNADVVQFSSYAPLLAKRSHTRWNPDLIYFDNISVFPTISYRVQQLFSLNAGNAFLPTKLGEPAAPSLLAASAVRDAKSGEVIVKVVNGAEESRKLLVTLEGLGDGQVKGSKIILSAPGLDAFNEDSKPPAEQVNETDIDLEKNFELEVPGGSLTILRLAEPE